MRRMHTKMERKRIQNIDISLSLFAGLMIVLVTLPAASGVQPPRRVVTSCDANGTEVNQFAPGEEIYVKGEAFLKNNDYKIWIQYNPLWPGDTLNASEDPSGEQELITTDGDGTFGPTLIWSIPLNAPATYDEWDIVVDRQNQGINTGKYNEASDGLDVQLCSAGIVAPTPDVSGLALFASGLGLLSVYFVYGKWSEEKDKKGNER